MMRCSSITTIQLLSQKLISDRSTGGPVMVASGATGAGMAGGAGGFSMRWLPKVGERGFKGVSDAELLAEPLRELGSPRAELPVGVEGIAGVLDDELPAGD